MVGYGELLQTMGAMIIFSMILLSANSMIQRNTLIQVEGELEQEVIALAQDIIEEGRTKEFDERSQGAAPPAKIPGDFSSPSSLGTDATTNTSANVENDDTNSDGTIKRSEFDDFDDYDGWKDEIETEHGKFNIEAKVFYADPSTYDYSGSRTTFKKMQVEITSKFLTNSSNERTVYKLEYIRNYYAD
ncbi:type IV pilus modification PilV family protein [Fodinibius halophilus]|uniref:Uncharacterized protein n=1 Tax=Fodinibius halophilus TaxID=1736908 RepID=A0A6M1TA37_9BACT|nr:hypothetical protein [Fodinibius halophilus]NGP87824.1 hypothetical protein [Fodinibius halophilus]